MSHKIQTALSLDRGDLGVFIKAWAWLLYIDLLLRSRPYPRVQQFVASRNKEKNNIFRSLVWESIHYHRRLVRLAARNHLYPMECLRQALALKAMLGAKGIPTDLRFGARKDADQLLAHAWLEYEGQSIELSHGNIHFEPLTTLKERQ